ncbi:MAG: cell surface protein SprA [Prevotellaceae bacterium]|jgi:cell surface protein SprA|nr:cell surface protein SprA [Prevotellaceae bacterium]
MAIFAASAAKGLAAPDADTARLWQPTVKESDVYKVDYDEKSGLYTFRRKDAGEHSQPAKVMNSDEYRRYQFNNSVREAWNTRRNNDLNASARSSEGGSSKLIPTSFDFNSSVMTSLFGSDVIKFNLQGEVEAIFGYNWTRTDNPTVPEQYRTHGGFDFKVNMKVNLSGSIGDRININFVNSTDLTFNFQDLLKINYQGDEDQIVQRIEAGNVSLPLAGSLITGSQNLFGFRTDLKFGHLTIESVLSEQKGQSSTINVKGGAQTTLFDIAIDKYDANRHFFLARYFREKYNNALRYLPLIQSGITITRLEVWITNRNYRFENSRNIIALDTLGNGNTPQNANNLLYNKLKNDDAARTIATANGVLEGTYGLQPVRDYEKVENARRLAVGNEYSFNAQLGYISLTSALTNDEVLAVAFEYTLGGKTYRVGEFYDDGVAAPKALYLKLLKGSNLSPRYNTWALMMKNIYDLNAYQLSSDNFLFNIMYHDDVVGTNVPYITEGKIANLPLLQVLNLDNQNSAGNRYPDGRFDFVEGLTVQSNYGRIIFPLVEPFGKDLAAKIDPNNPKSATAQKYVFQELYDSTLVKARQMADKNKFRLTGSYKSSSSSEIILNATDIPEGSVVVTAGGIRLIENVDYTVNYAMGRVQIINPVYMGSNVPLQVSTESMDMYSLVKKTMVGTNLRYQFSKDFKLGGTILHLSEKPLTQKVSYGEEPLSNTIWGLNGSYSTEVNLLTKMVDAIPLIETKAPSRITLEAEMAQLLPGHASAIGKSGTTFIDDFEAAQTTIDLKQFTTWSLGSTPEHVADAGGYGFTGGSRTTDLNNPLSNGYYRAKVAWYVIDPLFLNNTSSTPSYMNDDAKTYRKNHYVREVYEKELFPNKDVVIGTLNANLSVLNVAYYPNERGPYNYLDVASTASGKGLNPDGSLKRPATNFGSLMRALTLTDFETNNVEYLEFWMLDPFIYSRNSANKSKYSHGRLYFNLGNVSEDVLKDGRKAFENGLPYPYDDALVEETPWGRVPKVQSLVNTFDNNEAARAIQDVGYDGIDNERERTFFSEYLNHLQGVLSDEAFRRFEDDPSNDEYHYYRGSDYDAERLGILDRYKRYNNSEGNSPVASGGLATSATTMPNTEDINHDNTLNEMESYYEYYIDLTPDAISPERVGQNYITDIRTVDVADADYGDFQKVSWYQFKIPIADGKACNGIEDYKSMRFMRMFFSGLDSSVICRFAKLELMRSEWRQYEYSLLETQEGLAQPEAGVGTMDIASVSIEENSDRIPVSYVLPPGTSRIVDYTTNQQVQRNEQAMMFTIKNLSDGDARASYKNATYDMRQFLRLQMDVHAEAINESRLRNNDLSLFIRIGNDYRYNYYEYEIPLQLTPHGHYNNNNDNHRAQVWPAENKLDIPLSVFTDLKLERNSRMRTTSGMTIASLYEKSDGKNTVRVMGNPNLGEVHVLMIGVKNPANRSMLSNDDGLSKDGIVWINELRFTNFSEDGSWAANARIAANLADFANISLAGSYSKAGFGSIDSRILNRPMEDAYQYDLSTTFELGKFFPTKWGVTLPFGFAYSENFVVPLYNPFDPDIKLQDALDKASSQEERDELSEKAITYRMRRNINFNNVHIAGSGEKTLGPLDVSNFTAGYAYSEELMHDVNTERDYKVTQRINGAYAYTTKPYTFEPFAKSKGMKGDYWKIIRDFNLALYPNQYGFTWEFTDGYNEYMARSFYEGIKITPIIFQEQTQTRGYVLNWDITRALKFNFSANNFSRREVSTGTEADTVDLLEDWRNMRYNHEWGLTYTVPLNKIPLLSWVTLSASYKGTYAWEAPQSVGGGLPEIGNTVSNSNAFQANAALNFVTLYNRSTFLKNINQETEGRSAKKRELQDVKYEQSNVTLIGTNKRNIRHNLRDATGIKVQVFDEKNTQLKVEMETVDNRTVAIHLPDDKSGKTPDNMKNLKVVVTGKAPVPENPLALIGKYSLRTVMMLRNINISYTRNGETMLPGYTPETFLLGLDRKDNKFMPGWDFIAGSQDDKFWGNFYGSPTDTEELPYMLSRANGNQWLIGGMSTGDTTYINPFAMNTTSNLSVRATIEPMRDLRIDLTMTQTYANSRTWYDINNSVVGNRPTETGSFSMSTISIFTAFENPKSETYYHSEAYDRFDDARATVSSRLAQKNAEKLGISPPINDSTGQYVGYSRMAQDVLIPAFEAGYLKREVNDNLIDYSKFLTKIPLPNWQITYSGLSRIEALKPLVKSATLSHSYRSTYSINSFTTNSNYLQKRDSLDTQGDFYSPYSISAVSLNEQIVLGNLDVTWTMGLQTSFKVGKNRRVDLSLTNNQIIENSTWEGTVGTGYTFNNVPQILNFSDKQGASTSLTLRADFTYRDDKNIIRNVAENTHQITDGRRNMAVKFTGDYALMKDLTFRIFFDWTEANPYVSAVNTENISFGISLRYVLGL